jgi:hypothetical protein
LDEFSVGLREGCGGESATAVEAGSGRAGIVGVAVESRLLRLVLVRLRFFLSSLCSALLTAGSSSSVSVPGCGTLACPQGITDNDQYMKYEVQVHLKGPQH